jgi:hypothetical protein
MSSEELQENNIKLKSIVLDAKSRIQGQLK